MRREEAVVGENFKVTTVHDDGGGKAQPSITVTFEAFGQVFIVEKHRGALLTRQEIPAPLSMPEIVAEVSKRYGVLGGTICSHNRHQTVKEARWMVIYLARKRTTASYPDIARYLGMNPSSVLHAYNEMEKRMSERRAVVVTANDNGQACAQMNTSAPSDVRTS